MLYPVVPESVQGRLAAVPLPMQNCREDNISVPDGSRIQSYKVGKGGCACPAGCVLEEDGIRYSNMDGHPSVAGRQAA